MEKDVHQSIQALAELQEIYKQVPFETDVAQSRPTPIIDGGIKH